MITVWDKFFILCFDFFSLTGVQTGVAVLGWGGNDDGSTFGPKKVSLLQIFDSLQRFGALKVAARLMIILIKGGKRWDVFFLGFFLISISWPWLIFLTRDGKWDFSSTVVEGTIFFRFIFQFENDGRHLVFVEIFSFLFQQLLVCWPKF